MARKGSPRPGQSAWSAELKEAFLALLRETGNASASARTLGHPNLFNNRRQSDPAFRRDWADAVAEADAKLGRAPSAFPEPAERKDAPRLPMTGDEIGDYLKPGRKRPQARPEPVIRRTANGRAQITLAQDGHWTSEIEADFLDRLSLSGNFEASARAVGFHPASVMYRVHKWPAFSRACDEALQEASTRLDYALVAHAHALLRRPGEEWEPGEADISFDPKSAMQILGFIDARRAGRTGRGRRKGPPDRSFEEAVESILGKIEAIEKHEALMKARGEAGEA